MEILPCKRGFISANMKPPEQGYVQPCGSAEYRFEVPFESRADFTAQHGELQEIITMFSKEEEEASLSVPSTLLFSDLPFLHSNTKRSSPLIFPLEKNSLTANGTCLPSTPRMFAPHIDSCFSESYKGNVCVDGEHAATAAIRRRSWDWEPTANEKRARSCFPLSDLKPICQTEPGNSGLQRQNFVPSPAESNRRSAILKKSTHPTWAGPTLLEIESALAILGQSVSANATNTSTSSVSSSLSEGVDDGTSRHRREAPLNEQRGGLHAKSRISEKTDDSTGSDEEKNHALLKKMQKRTVTEPKYTVKVRIDADTIEDGYRWRKYGQKFIKSSPHPRGYYRCTAAKCSVKKQVERSASDPGVLEVSYEGVHLHHRPNPLSTSIRPQLVEQEKDVLVASEQPYSSASKLLMQLKSQRSADDRLDHLKLQSRADPRFPLPAGHQDIGANADDVSSCLGQRLLEDLFLESVIVDKNQIQPGF